MRDGQVSGRNFGCLAKRKEDKQIKDKTKQILANKN